MVNGNSSRPAFVAVVLLLWLAIGPVIFSLLSFVGAMPTRWPALVHFAASPLQGRVLFFMCGCLAVTAVVLLRKGKLLCAFASTLAFTALYVPVFQIVWGQRTVALAAALVALGLVTHLLIQSRRREV